MLSDRIISSGRFSNRPLYLQLRDALAERIAGGEWKPSSAIPNESDLAREFGVSAGTMRKALDLMEAERLLTRRQGRGTFVNDQSSDELAARFSNIRGPDGKRVCGQVKSARDRRGHGERGGVRTAAAAARATASTASIAFCHHKGQVFLVEDVSLPAALFPSLATRRRPSPTASSCWPRSTASCWARRRSASPWRGIDGHRPERSGSPPARRIMVLDRVVLALDGRPIEWRMGWCHLVDSYYMAEMV